MKKFHLLFCLIIICNGFLKAQTQFQKVHGTKADDRNYNLTSLPNGKLVATGYTESVSGNKTDAILVGFSQFGEVEWSYTYGSIGDETGWDVISTAKNEIIAAGHTSSIGTKYNAGTVTLTDSQGKVQWTTAVYQADGNIEFYKVLLTKSGHIIATGLASTSSLSDEVIIAKFTMKGQLIWSKTYGTTESDEIMGLAETNEEDIVLAGLTSDKNGFGGSDFLILKVDSQGTPMWMYNYGSSSSERLNAVVIHNNNYYFSGWSSAAGAGKNDVVLMQTDSAGKINFVNTYGSPEEDRCFSMSLDADSSSIIMTGYTEKFRDAKANNRNTFLLKTDLKGKMLLNQSYGSSKLDGHWPTGLAMNKDEGYYLLGSTESFGSGVYDLYLIKTDKDGNAGCNMKSPDFKESNITTWKPSKWGKKSTIKTTYTQLALSEAKWSISSSTECCLLYADAGRDSLICPNTDFERTAFQVPGYSYEWIKNNNTISTDATLKVKTSLSSGYILEVSASKSNCDAAKDTFILHIDENPFKDIKQRDFEFCSNDSVEIDLNTKTQKINWYSKQNAINVHTGNSLFAQQEDTFILTHSTNNGCTFSDSVQAIEVQQPNSILPNDSFLCKGDSILISPSSKYDIKWIHDKTLGSNPIWVKSDTLLILELTNKMCNHLDSYKVELRQIPEIKLPNDTAICQNDSLILNANTNFSYTWLHDAKELNSQITVKKSGYYGLLYNDKFCINRDSFNLSINQLPESKLNNTYIICDNNPIVLTANKGYTSYNWNDSIYTDSIIINKQGAFKLKITDQNACTSQDSIWVENIMMPNRLFDNDSVAIKNGKAELSLSQSWESYDWSTNEKTETITVNREGWYVVSISNKEGCTKTDSVYAYQAVGINPTDFGFNIYPNPAKQSIIIQSARVLNAYSILNLQGKEVQNGSLNNNSHIDLNNLNSGVYFIRIMDIEGHQMVKKLIIQD